MVGLRRREGRFWEMGGGFLGVFRLDLSTKVFRRTTNTTGVKRWKREAGDMNLAAEGRGERPFVVFF